MATIDISRSATEHSKHYTSVRAQMGRVLTDDDHNENERLHAESGRRSLVDIIGPDGSPDQGFLIQNPTVTGGRINFDVTTGTFYLGGNRLVLEASEQFQTQRDWLDIADTDIPAAPNAGSRFDLVYLECWQQPVAAVEDNELFEVALAGPDTGDRMRLMRRVRVLADTAFGDCTQDWAALTEGWTKGGLGTVDSEDELKVDTSLTVAFEPGTDPDDLCSPPVGGGYLGAENQAIRVQLVTQTTFTWGFDNAAPLYQVDVGVDSLGNLRKVTLITLPKDQAHWPVAGQIVEILPWSAELSNGQKLADLHGDLRRVATAYDPDAHELFLDSDVSPGLSQGWKTPDFFYLRVWNRGTDTTSAPSIGFVNGTAVPLGNTGLNVTFNGSDHHPDDFWIIAARPQSPNRVVPWLLETGRGPHGVHRFYAPLAVIEWNAGVGQVIHDCRQHFPPLTGLTTCCTYTVGDGIASFGAYPTIQSAIAALPKEGGEVCLLPGVYSENVQILNKHDITLHGCGVRTILMGSGRDQTPVIEIVDSQHIEIRDLEIQAPTVVGVQITSTPAAEAQNSGVQTITLRNLDIQSRDASAIACDGGSWITIVDNVLEGSRLAEIISGTNVAGQSPLVFVRADDVVIEHNRITAVAIRRLQVPMGGLQVGGGSERVQIRRNTIQGGNGNGITLGSMRWVTAALGDGGVGRINVIAVAALVGLIVDSRGCVVPDPNPRPPKDPQGDPMQPQSDGDLYDIRITDNDILDMGTCGISTVRFAAEGFGPITVHGLEIERNRIRDCTQLELGEQPVLASNIVLGFGGITLIAAEDCVVRQNTISDNGFDFIDPICGMFIWLVRGLIAEENVIYENGPRVETNKQPTAGPRGGIVVMLAMPPLSSAAAGLFSSDRAGFPAARIVDNIVTAPLGRALLLGGRGPMMVVANSFTSRGVEVDSTFAGFGAAAMVFNTGRTHELTEFGGYSGLAAAKLVVGSSAAALPSVGGTVSFDANQVLLQPEDARTELTLASITVATADDVGFDANQSECRLSEQQNVLFNGLVIGWTTRVTDNRFEERLVLPGLSALSLAAMNTTANNQGTRCFISLGLPAVLVNSPNRSLISLTSADDPCAVLQRQVFDAVRPSGFQV
jgi:hypothetical protein